MANYATLHRAAKELGVSYYTARDYAKKKFFPLYKLPGVSEMCADLDEVRAWNATRDRRRARTNYGNFDGAIVRDLSNVAATFEVER